MRTLRLSLIGTVMLALLGGLGSAALAQMDVEADAVYVTWVSDGEVAFDLRPTTRTSGSTLSGRANIWSARSVVVWAIGACPSDLVSSNRRLSGR